MTVNAVGVFIHEMALHVHLLIHHPPPSRAPPSRFLAPCGGTRQSTDCLRADMLPGMHRVS